MKFTHLLTKKEYRKYRQQKKKGCKGNKQLSDNQKFIINQFAYFADLRERRPDMYQIDFNYNDYLLEVH